MFVPIAISRVNWLDMSPGLKRRKLVERMIVTSLVKRNYDRTSIKN